MTSQEAFEIYNQIVDYVIENDSVYQGWTLVSPWKNIIDHDDVVDNPFDKYINRIFKGCYIDTELSVCTIFVNGVYTNIVCSYYACVSVNYGYFDDNGNFVIESYVEGSSNPEELFREKDYGTRFVGINENSISSSLLDLSSLDMYLDKENGIYFIPEDEYDDAVKSSFS